MHSGTAYIISNLFLTIMWFTAASIVLDCKYSRIKTILIESIIQFGLWYILENTINIFTPLRILVGFGLPMLLIFIFHTDKSFFKLLTASLIFISDIAAEIILGALMPYESILSGEFFAKYDVAIYSIYQLLNLTLLSLVIAALRAYKQRYQGYLIEKQWFLFFLFPLSQTIAMCGWWPAYLQYNTMGSPYKVLALTVFSFLADAALIYAIRETGAASEMRIRSEMLEEQVKSQENYYDQLASTYSNIRKMRHDIDNHIYAIEGLLKNNEVQKAAEYIQKVREEDTTVHFADCQNTVVSSYLTKKMEDLTSAGIAFEPNIHLPYLVGISNPDLICIYGNILDNVKEACKEIPDSTVTLDTKYKEPYLIISCTNPIKETQEQKKRRIPELERGIGFTIISNLVRQYDGQFSARSENGMFCTEIILKVKTGEEHA